MKKLSLNLDDLSVETFAPSETPAAARGTVHGHQTWQWNGCTAAQPCNPISQTDYTEDYTCNQHTCQGSCFGTCYHTCRESCNCETQYASCAWTCQETTPC